MSEIVRVVIVMIAIGCIIGAALTGAGAFEIRAERELNKLFIELAALTIFSFGLAMWLMRLAYSL